MQIIRFFNYITLINDILAVVASRPGDRKVPSSNRPAAVVIVRSDCSHFNPRLLVGPVSVYCDWVG